METIFVLIVLIFSIIIHEIAHGAVAQSMGDYTAKNSGRLTLNPLKHLDPFGSIALPLFMLIFYKFTGSGGPIFGWAKPVPVNPFNFRDQKYGGLKVALAGPASNFLLAVIFCLLIRFLPLPQQIIYFFSIIAIYNFILGIFNLIPIPPLDGSHILFSLLPKSLKNIEFFLRQFGFYILILFLFSGLRTVLVVASILFSFFTGIRF